MNSASRKHPHLLERVFYLDAYNSPFLLSDYSVLVFIYCIYAYPLAPIGCLKAAYIKYKIYNIYKR